MKTIHSLVSQNLGYVYGERESGPNGAKKQFHTTSKAFRRALGNDLGFTECKVTVNPGGIAVSGEITLMGMWGDGNGLYLQLFQSITGNQDFLFRQIKNMKDYSGGRNQWLYCDLFANGEYERLTDMMHNDWVTKYDGAENTDIEPIKGGLSDSFKRAACVWGIGRYLYELGGIWVEIEQRGKSSIIKENQYAKLKAEYNNAISKMFGAPTTQGNPPAAPANTSQPPQRPVHSNTPQVVASYDYLVQSVKPSGKESQLLELINSTGQVISAYIKSSDKAVKPGSKLQNVNIVPKQSSYGQYNLISGYQIAA